MDTAREPHRPTAVISSHAEALAAADAFAASLHDTVIERDRSGALPVAELARLDASGLLGLTVPATDGGPELGSVTLTEVARRPRAIF